jgi:hypothetical protein
MRTIFKTWKKATYFEGIFELRNVRMAVPIKFPLVLTAYGKGIKSGFWRSCTSINAPKYVIGNYFDGVGHCKHDAMYQLFCYCDELSNITWKDVDENREMVLDLIDLANNELLKLKTL